MIATLMGFKSMHRRIILSILSMNRGDFVFSRLNATLVLLFFLPPSTWRELPGAIMTNGVAWRSDQPLRFSNLGLAITGLRSVAGFGKGWQRNPLL